MKNHLLSAISCGFFCMAFIMGTAQSESLERTVVVLQLDALDGERNMAIHSHFKESDSFRLINSCEVLSIVVIDSDLPLNSARLRIDEEMDAIGIHGSKLLADKTATEVMIECRQRMTELLEPESGE